jgi:hypothetical protein
MVIVLNALTQYRLIAAVREKWPTSAPLNTSREFLANRLGSTAAAQDRAYQLLERENDGDEGAEIPSRDRALDNATACGHLLQEDRP